MAEKIPVRDFEHQTMSAVLGGQRYSITLRWNETCGYWTIQISQNGEVQFGHYPLQENGFVGDANSCLPASFGGLFLEVIDSNVTGSEALISGAQCLWFFDSAEVFAIYGTIDAP